MRFIDRMLGRGSDPEAQPIVKTARIRREDEAEKAVREGPGDFNRRTRRAYKSSFRWLSPLKMGNALQAPRYARRHGLRVLAKSEAPKTRTRRERKEAARIGRLAARGAL